MKDTRDPDLLTLGDVAVALGIGRATINRMRAAGQVEIAVEPERKGQAAWVHRTEVERLKREYVPGANRGGRGKRRQLAS